MPGVMLGSGNGSWPGTAEGEPYGRCAEWYETSDPWGELARSKAACRCWCAMSCCCCCCSCCCRSCCCCCSSAEAETAAAATAAAAAATAALSLSIRLLMSMTPSEGGEPDIVGVWGEEGVAGSRGRGAGEDSMGPGSLPAVRSSER